ncbi:hypothetical protein C8R45DRAFT_1091566 [Mycena sanguinolenta]|nr:hypothetical protein C8R45DRAFT_1091566 [Mycena sanguinolenta]
MPNIVFCISCLQRLRASVLNLFASSVDGRSLSAVSRRICLDCFASARLLLVLALFALLFVSWCSWCSRRLRSLGSPTAYPLPAYDPIRSTPGSSLLSPFRCPISLVALALRRIPLTSLPSVPLASPRSLINAGSLRPRTHDAPKIIFFPNVRHRRHRRTGPSSSLSSAWLVGLVFLLLPISYFPCPTIAYACARPLLIFALWWSDEAQGASAACARACSYPCRLDETRVWSSFLGRDEAVRVRVHDTRFTFAQAARASSLPGGAGYVVPVI